MNDPLNLTSNQSDPLGLTKSNVDVSGLIAKHFSGNDAPTFEKIAQAESSGNPYATHANKNGTKDHGVMQINDVNVPELKKAGKINSVTDLYDAEKNIESAAYLKGKYGTRPWDSSKGKWGNDVPEPSPFPIDHWVNDHVKDLPPEEQANKRDAIGNVISNMAQPWLASGYSASSSVNRSLANFSETLDTMARFFESNGYGKREGFFESMAKASRDNADYMARRADEEGVNAITELTGEVMALPSNALIGLTDFLLKADSAFSIPAIEGYQKAKEAGTSPFMGGLLEAAKYKVLSSMFELMQPFNKYIQAGVMSGTFGLQGAIDAPKGQKIQEALKGAATGAAFGLTGEGGEWGIRDIYPEVGSGIPSYVREQIANYAKNKVKGSESAKEPEPTGVEDASGKGERGLSTDNLKPAVKVGDAVLEGIPGEKHDDVLEREGTKEGKDTERGFTTPEGDFLNRKEAANWMKGNKPEAFKKWKEQGGKDELYSEDYREAVKATEPTEMPKSVGSAAPMTLEKPPVFEPPTKPKGIFGTMGKVYQKLYEATTIDILPKLSRYGVPDNAVQHAGAKTAAPRIVNNFQAKIFPDDYKNPEVMDKTIDVINKNNILGGYDSFKEREQEAKDNGDLALEKKWRNAAEEVAKVHDLDAYDKDCSKARKGATQPNSPHKLWKQHWVPAMDQLYNEAKNVDVFTEREGRGRYPELGGRINLVTKESVARWQENQKEGNESLPEPSASSYRNPNVKHDPFDLMAHFTGDYSTDAKAVMTAAFGKRWHEVTKIRFYNDLIENGVAIDSDTVQEMPEGYKGLPIKFPKTNEQGRTKMEEKMLYVPSELVQEIRGVLGADMKGGKNKFAEVMTDIQLFQIADLTTHVSNQMSVLTRALGAGSIGKDIATRLPFVGSADAIRDTIKTYHDIAEDSPEIREEIAGLAQRGLIRPDFPQTGISKITRGQQIIHAADTAARVILNRRFNELVDRKWVDDTEMNRRDFVNQIGNYNKRLMGPFMARLSDMGLSPFIVAGRNFNRQGRWAMTGNPGVEGASLNAATKMRVMNFLGIASLFTMPMLLNYITTGKVSGRSGTPLGAWDLGMDEDEKGQHKIVDLLKWSGIRRGMRSTGIDAWVEGVRTGKTMNQIVGKAVRDIYQTALHPWLGPAVTGTIKTITGTQLDMRGTMDAQQMVEGGGYQYLENLRAALESQNPLVYSIVKPAFQEAGLDQKPSKGYKEDLWKTILKSPSTAAGVKDVSPDKTAAEETVANIWQKKLGTLKGGKAKQERTQTTRELEKGIEKPDSDEKIAKGIEEGTLTESDFAKILNKADLTSTEKVTAAVQMFDVPSSIAVWKTMNDEEKEATQDIILAKFERWDASDKEKAEVEKDIEKIEDWEPKKAKTKSWGH